MIFTDLSAGDAVFMDANTLVYRFSLHPKFGPACTDLLDRIDRQELAGYTSTHVLSETAHRLMTLEAITAFGWPQAGILIRRGLTLSHAIVECVRVRAPCHARRGHHPQETRRASA